MAGRARLMGRDARCDVFVRVPVPDGRTWPPDRRSRPTAEAPFVEAGLLHELASMTLKGA